MKKITTLYALLLSGSMFAQLPSNGKIIHLEFESNDAKGLFHDITGNNPNPTVTGTTPTSVMGIAGTGTAVNFVASGGNPIGYLQYTNGIFGQPGSNQPTTGLNYTFSSMIKLNSGDVGLFGYGSSQGNNANNVKITGNNTITNYWWANDYILNSTVNLVGAWHQITVSYNDNTKVRKIYLDGTLLGSQSNPPTPNYSAYSAFYIGTTIAGERMDGLMENFIGYNRALSDQEVAQVYAYSQCTGTLVASVNAVGNLATVNFSNLVQPITINAISIGDTLKNTLVSASTFSFNTVVGNTYAITAVDANGCEARTSVKSTRQLTCDDFATNSSLVLHLPFSGNANDVSSTGATPSANSGTFVADKCGNLNSAYHLGANEELKFSLGAFPALKAGTNGELTVTCWAKSDASGFSTMYPTFVEIGDVAYLRSFNGYYRGGIHNANTGVGTYGYVEVTAINAITDYNNWHFYALVYNMNDGNGKGLIRAYQDSVAFSTQTATNMFNLPVSYSITATNNNYLSIGGGAASGASKKFTGTIDNVMVFNSALSADAIKDIRYGNVLTSINSVKPAKLELALYPNPANDVLMLESSELLKAYSITDLMGKVVLQSNFSNTNLQQQIQLGDLNEGVYLVKITSDNGLVTYRKICIKR